MSQWKSMRVVVEYNSDKTLTIVENILEILGICDTWINSPNLWDNPATYHSDSGSVLCKILYIGTPDGCNEFLKLRKQETSSVNLDTGSIPSSILEEMRFLRNKIESMEKLADKQQSKINQLEAACDPHNIIKGSIRIGVHKMMVPVGAFAQALVHDLTSAGLMNLIGLSDVLSKNFSVEKNWRHQDVDDQDKIEDLLANFVLIGLSREIANPKPSQLNQKYREIHTSFTTMLNNRKYHSNKDDQPTRRLPRISKRKSDIVDSNETELMEPLKKAARIMLEENSNDPVINDPTHPLVEESVFNADIAGALSSTIKK